jgi:hypothetical protein
MAKKPIKKASPPPKKAVKKPAVVKPEVKTEVKTKEAPEDDSNVDA